MAIVYDSITRVDLTLWKFVGHSTLAAPVGLRAYANGIKILDITSADGTFTLFVAVGIGTGLFLQVLDKACDAPDPAYPGEWDLHWYWDAADTKYYRIEQFLAAVWTQVATMPHFTAGYQMWKTPWLAEGQNDFRVVPVLAGDQEAAPIAFSGEMVRHPDTPNQNFSYSSGTARITALA